MSIGLKKTVLNLLEGLVREKAINIKWCNENTIIATIRDIQNWNRLHTISVKYQTNRFSGEVENFQWESILLDDSPVKQLADLAALGFSEQQFSVIQQNIEATDYLESIYEECTVSTAKILQVISHLTGLPSLLVFDRDQPHAFATLLATVPPREALIITETCGNIDGSTGNPLKNIMLGSKPNAIAHHPIPVAYYSGTSQIQLVSYPKAAMVEIGSIPERLREDFKFYTDDRLIPMNKYAVQVACQELNVQRHIDAFVLLSKRSLMPTLGDYQLKTSFPAQITSESRLINWDTAEDAIECGRVVSLLAKMQKLPENVWVLPTLFAAQVKDDDNTTFYIRGGLIDAYSNGIETGIPNNLTPVIACALTSRNILTPGRTLFESMITYGFDPVQLFTDITVSIIYAQLHFINIRWIPDAHTQNVAYLFDMKLRKFGGLLLKDSECEKNKIIRGGKLADSVLSIPSELKMDSVSKERLILSTLYFHHTIYTKHIEPLASILIDKYAVPIEKIQTITHKSLTSWLERNPDSHMKHKIDLSGRYYERNLASKTLKIGISPHHRIILNHKLLPIID